MNKLSRREKILIYVLACFLIGMFGLYFVVKPSFENYLAVSAQVEEAQFTQQSMEMAIDNIPAIMQSRDDGNLKLAELKTPFSAELPNEGVDKLLTQLCLGYSLSPRSLAIQSNELQNVETFTEHYSENGASAAVGGTNTTTATENTNNANTTGGTQTRTSVVKMEVTGNQANFYRLLDAVANRPDIIISSFDITSEALPQTGTTNSGTTTTSVSYSGYVPKLSASNNVVISVTFTVYMVAK